MEEQVNILVAELHEAIKLYYYDPEDSEGWDIIRAIETKLKSLNTHTGVMN